jgi:hypothetical protein
MEGESEDLELTPQAKKPSGPNKAQKDKKDKIEAAALAREERAEKERNPEPEICLDAFDDAP